MRYGRDFTRERHNDRAAVFRVKRLEVARRVIPENGVEDREKLPHHGNEGDLLGSATGSELVVEGPKGDGAGWQSEPPCIARRALTSDHRQWPCGHASDQSCD